MQTRRMNVVLACATLLFGWTGISAQVVVQTPNGKLQGTVQNGVASFKGVPFAQPPVGDLRLRPPLPAKPWSGIRKADAFSAGCMQHKDISRGPWVEQYMLHRASVTVQLLALRVTCKALVQGFGRILRS